MKVMEVKGRESEEKINGIYKFVLDKAKVTAKRILERIGGSEADKGGVLMVVGPLASGKSVVALRLEKEFVAEKMGGRRLRFVQPLVDRKDVPCGWIYSRTGEKIKAFSFKTKREIERMFHESEVVVCDEVQFVPYEVQSFFVQELMMFVDRGGWFVGLAVDYACQGGEFILPALLKTRALKVWRLESLCQMCGGRARRYCQRLVNGKVAGIGMEVLLGPSEEIVYEPRCDECFVIKK